MQKWEVATLVVLAILVVITGVNETLSNGLTDLLDTLFVQVVALVAVIGVTVVSPVIGIATTVFLALVYVIRNNSLLQNKILSPIQSALLTQTEETEVESDLNQGPVNEDSDVPEGQYPINTDRPTENLTKREYEFKPFSDTGKNDFLPVGESIDEKLSIPPSVRPWSHS
jgi:hypothetical protein